ncbi:MAG: FAD:protein FMN transferase, partial [Bdellovibrionota bacterium]
MSWVQVRLDQNHMATTFELHVSCDEARARAAEAVLRHAHREIARLENELSEFREGSPVFGLNRARAFEPVRITNSVRDLLQLAESLRGKSQGAFNPLCKSAPGKGAVLIAADGKHFFKTEDGVRLGFGAIGKGYALDQVKLLLVREGFSDYLLSAGGSSILLSGFAAPETPWTWAWSWKKDADGAYRGKRFAHASGRPVALGVSGTLEQGEHILHAE